MKKWFGAFFLMAVIVSPAHAALCDSFKTISTTNSPYSLSSSDFGECLSVDATAGPVVIDVPAAPTLGAGSLNVKKIDVTSNLVSFSGGPFEAGENLASLPLSLEQDAGTLASDGSGWTLRTPGLATLRHNPWVAEHTITATMYSIDPTYNGYIMLVDTCSAGASVYMQLPAIASAAFHHQTYSVKVHRIDSCAEPSLVVSVVANSTSDYIADNHTSSANGTACGSPGGLCKIDETQNYQDLFLWTDGARWIVPDLKGF